MMNGNRSRFLLRNGIFPSFVLLVASASVAGASPRDGARITVLDGAAEDTVPVERPAPPGFTVAPQLDDSRAVSGVIASSGGQLSVTSADGTVFTLTVPDGALLSPEEITMTPVASVEGLPLSGGLVAAVQLAPDGVVFFQPVSLVITLPAAVPADQEITFAWRGDGHQFILFPPDPVGTAAVSLSVFHLSGYGVGRGTGGDEAAQLLRVPDSADDELEQDLQESAAEERGALRAGAGFIRAGWSSASLTGQKTSAQSKATQYLNDFFLHVLGPAQPLKCSDDWKAFLRMLATFKQRVLKLTGPDQTLLNAAAAYRTSVYTLLAGCYDKAYDLCRSDLDPFQGEEMGRLWAAILQGGTGVRVDPGKIGKCLTFELRFDSFLTEDDSILLVNFQGASLTLKHTAKATIPLISATTLTILNDHPITEELKYTPDRIYNPGASGCSLTVSGSSSVFSLKAIEIDVNVFPGLPRDKLTVHYDPGHPDMTIKLGCPQSPVQTIVEPRWSEIYQVHHATEFFVHFDATDWKKTGKTDPYATKFYDPITDYFGEEHTFMFLFHTPQ